MKKIISVILSILLVLSLAGNTYLFIDKKNAATELDAFETNKLAELASLNEKIALAEADLLAETEKYNQALEAILQMDEQTKSLQQEIEIISGKLTEAEEATANTEALLSEANQRAEDDEKLLTEKTQEIESLMAVIEDKDAAFASLSESYAALEKGQSEKENSLAEKIAELENTVSEHAALNSRTQEALDLKAQEYEALRAEYEKNVFAAQTYSDEIKRLESDIASLKAEAETYEGTISSLKTALDENGEALTLIDEINALTASLKEMEIEAEGKNNEINALNELIESLKDEKSTLETKLSLSSCENESAMELVEASESELNKTREALRNTEKALEEAENALSEMTEQLAQSDAEKQAFADTLEKQEAEKIEAEAKISELMAEIEKTENALAENRRIADETAAELSEARSSLDAIMSENEVLKAALEEADSKINLTQKALDEANRTILDAEEQIRAHQAAYDEKAAENAALDLDLTNMTVEYYNEVQKNEALTAELTEAADALESYRIALMDSEALYENSMNTLSDVEALLSDTRDKLEKTESELSATKAQLESVTSDYNAYIAKRTSVFSAESEIGTGITDIAVQEGKADFNFTNNSDSPVRITLVTDSGEELFSRTIYPGYSIKEVPAETWNSEACWLKTDYLDAKGDTLYSLITPVTVTAE